MKKNSVDITFEKLRENLEYRAEASLLDVSEVLSEQIKIARDRKGLSQAELAKLLGTKQSQVSRLEDPFYTRYSLLTLAKVADVLGQHLRVSLDDVESIALQKPITVHQDHPGNSNVVPLRPRSVIEA